MSEREWLSSDDPQRMLLLEGVRGVVSERKGRLFACACCREVWPLLADPRSRAAVEAAERYADGRASADELAAARGASAPVVLAPPASLVSSHGSIRYTPATAATAAADTDRFAPGGVAFQVELVAEEAIRRRSVPKWPELPAVRGRLAPLLRDVAGNPFRRPPFDARWRTADTTGLAAAIYEERAFDRLPLLADALTDAGCADERVIGHCRGGGPHVRGCWVVDLVLGKQ